MPPKSRAKKTTAPRKGKKRDELVSDDDSYDDISVEDAVEALDSDNLDDDDADTAKRGKKTDAKRQLKPDPPKSRKRRKRADSDEEVQLEEGQVVVGKIVRAPKTGQGEAWTFQGRFRLNVSSSSSRTDISEHVQLSGSACRTGMQRPRMVSSVLTPTHSPFIIDV
jgi:hypothetical protein